MHYAGARRNFIAGNSANIVGNTEQRPRPQTWRTCLILALVVGVALGLWLVLKSFNFTRPLTTKTSRRSRKMIWSNSSRYPRKLVTRVPRQSTRSNWKICGTAKSNRPFRLECPTAISELRSWRRPSRLNLLSWTCTLVGTGRSRLQCRRSLSAWPRRIGSTKPLSSSLHSLDHQYHSQNNQHQGRCGWIQRRGFSYWCGHLLPCGR